MLKTKRPTKYTIHQGHIDIKALNISFKKSQTAVIQPILEIGGATLFN